MLEFDIIGLKGTRRHMETTAVPLPVADGGFTHLAVTRDVTERKAMEQALRDADTRKTTSSRCWHTNCATLWPDSQRPCKCCAWRAGQRPVEMHGGTVTAESEGRKGEYVYGRLATQEVQTETVIPTTSKKVPTLRRRILSWTITATEPIVWHDAASHRQRSAAPRCVSAGVQRR